MDPAKYTYELAREVLHGGHLYELTAAAVLLQDLLKRLFVLFLNKVNVLFVVPIAGRKVGASHIKFDFQLNAILDDVGDGTLADGELFGDEHLLAELAGHDSAILTDWIQE